jgi:uncharacterized protein with PQ loop repeat
MNINTLEVIANAMQMSIPLLSLTAYIPQWAKLFKTQSSTDISLRSWSIWIISGLFAFFYAVVHFFTTGTGWPLIISSVANLIFVSITVILIALYRKTPCDTYPR